MVWAVAERNGPDGLGRPHRALQVEELLTEGAAVLEPRHYGLGLTEVNHRGMQPNRSGNSGRYFMVRNWLSEYGLSSET